MAISNGYNEYEVTTAIAKALEEFYGTLISKIDTAPAIFYRITNTMKYQRKRHDTKTFPKGIVFFWEIVH